jgi:hypothetical protein
VRQILNLYSYLILRPKRRDQLTQYN